MRGLAERGTEKAMEMKFRETGLARRLPEQNTGLIFGGEKVTSATEPTKGVVMEELRHDGMILPSSLSALCLRVESPPDLGRRRILHPIPSPL